MYDISSRRVNFPETCKAYEILISTECYACPCIYKQFTK